MKNAIAITAMEGGRPSEYCLEQLALFEAGEISATEMCDRVIHKARGWVSMCNPYSITTNPRLPL